MPSDRNQTYWVVDKIQLKVLKCPRCHEISDRLAASGPMSAREIAGHLGIAPTSVYHHLNQMLPVGLLVEAGTRPGRRRPEQLYATPAPRMRLARAVAENKHPKEMREIVSAITRQMARDFALGSGLPSMVAEGEERNLGFLRMTGRPSPAQLARINACLAEISEILWNSSGNSRQMINFGWVIAPAD